MSSVNRCARFVGMNLRLVMESCLLPAMNVLSPFVDFAMSMKEEKEPKLALSAKLDTSGLKVWKLALSAKLETSSVLITNIDVWVLISGSPRVEGDEEEDDTDDIEHEFDYGVEILRQGSGPVSFVYGRSGHAGTYEYGSSSRQGSSTDGMEIPLLTYGEEVNILVSP